MPAPAFSCNALYYHPCLHIGDALLPFEMIIGTWSPPITAFGLPGVRKIKNNNHLSTLCHFKSLPRSEFLNLITTPVP